jgi:hypothetical protein
MKPVAQQLTAEYCRHSDSAQYKRISGKFRILSYTHWMHLQERRPSAQLFKDRIAVRRPLHPLDAPAGAPAFGAIVQTSIAVSTRRTCIKRLYLL